MGILCDLFIASDDEALAYDSFDGSWQARQKRYTCVSYKGLTFLEFGLLWAILSGEEWAPERHMLIDVSLDADGERWLCRFPDDYVQLLVTQGGEENIGRFAEQWGKVKELNCPGENLHPVIRDLIALAGQAKSARCGLFLWGSV